MFEKWREKLASKAREDEEAVQFKSYEEEKEEMETIAPAEEENEGASIEGKNIELKVVRPESMDEIFTIADYLIDGCTVVLNLELLDREPIKRMLDFLNGVTYTMGGDVKNVAPSTYIITPGGINVNK